MPKRFLKVLVVEDSVEQAESLELLLKSEGYSCYSAIGVESGIARCKVHPPDVVILDWVMPPPGGMGFLEWFRGQDIFRRTPVLITTGLDGSQIPDLFPDHTLVLLKPYRPEELIRFLDAAVAAKVKS